MFIIQINHACRFTAVNDFLVNEKIHRKKFFITQTNRFSLKNHECLNFQVLEKKKKSQPNTNKQLFFGISNRSAKEESLKIEEKKSCPAYGTQTRLKSPAVIIKRTSTRFIILPRALQQRPGVGTVYVTVEFDMRRAASCGMGIHNPPLPHPQLFQPDAGDPISWQRLQIIVPTTFRDYFSPLFRRINQMTRESPLFRKKKYSLEIHASFLPNLKIYFFVLGIRDAKNLSYRSSGSFFFQFSVHRSKLARRLQDERDFRDGLVDVLTHTCS